MEKCSKPGCGAQRIIGHPCSDWDCPQQTVTAAEYQKLERRLEATVREIEAEKRARETLVTERIDYYAPEDSIPVYGSREKD